MRWSVNLSVAIPALRGPRREDRRRSASRAQRRRREAARERGQQAYERAEAHHRARDAETREALATWNAIDVNADGVVAGDEMDSLGTLLTTVGEPLSDDELEAFIADVDKNGDGAIGRREFMVWMRESVSDPEED